MACLSQWECSRTDATNSPEKLPAPIFLAGICAGQQWEEKSPMLVGSGGCNIPIINTATLSCDPALFLVLAFNVLLDFLAAESAVMTSGYFSFLKWITHLPFVWYERLTPSDGRAKTLCFESFSVGADSVIDNAPVHTGKELEPTCNWKMNAWHGLLWHWNAAFSFEFHI